MWPTLSRCVLVVTLPIVAASGFWNISPAALAQPGDRPCGPSAAHAGYPEMFRAIPRCADLVDARCFG